MHRLFVNYYITDALKNDNRFLQIVIASLLFACPVIFNQSLINFLIGKPIGIYDIAITLLLIYSLINLAHAVFYKVEKKESREILQPQTSSIKTSPKTESTFQNKTTFTLARKNYSKQQSVRSIPKLTLPQKEALPDNIILSEAPPLEVNFDSAPEAETSAAESLSHEYTGEQNESEDYSASTENKDKPDSQQKNPSKNPSDLFGGTGTRKFK